jgi:hypothetical protein
MGQAEFMKLVQHTKMKIPAQFQLEATSRSHASAED